MIKGTGATRERDSETTLKEQQFYFFLMADILTSKNKDRKEKH